MKSYTLTLRFTSNPDDGYQYLVEVYRQPLHRYLIARAYHWYDIRVSKVPGVKAFERWHAKKFRKDFTYVHFCDRRDIKCAFLVRKGREVLATFEVDEATYVRLGGRAVKEA